MRLAAIVTIAVLTAATTAACGDDDASADPQATATVTQSVTETATVTAAPTVAPTSEAPSGGDPGADAAGGSATPDGVVRAYVAAFSVQDCATIMSLLSSDSGMGKCGHFNSDSTYTITNLEVEQDGDYADVEILVDKVRNDDGGASDGDCGFDVVLENSMWLIDDEECSGSGDGGDIDLNLYG
jgi:hypothetical protein